MTTPCQEEYATLLERTPGSVGELLARRGRAFDQSLRQEYLESTFPPCESAGDPWFVPAALVALRWSRHAIPTQDAWDDYVESGRRFFMGDGPADGLRHHAGRFGPDRLVLALDGYRSLLISQRRNLFDAVPASLERLLANQEQLIALLGSPVLEAGVSNTLGIGPWLGLAPHKILLIWERRWWGNPASDDVLQPLGSVVTRGLQRLASDGVVPHDLVTELRPENEERADGFSSVAFGQAIQRELALAAYARLMHINSGLYELGYRGE